MTLKWKDSIEDSPEVMLGKPVFKGARLTVEHIPRGLGTGLTLAFAWSVSGGGSLPDGRLPLRRRRLVHRYSLDRGEPLLKWTRGSSRLGMRPDGSARRGMPPWRPTRPVAGSSCPPTR